MDAAGTDGRDPSLLSGPFPDLPSVSMEPHRGGDTGDLVCERIHPPSVLVMPNDLTRRYEIRTPLTDRPPMELLTQLVSLGPKSAAQRRKRVMTWRISSGGSLRRRRQPVREGLAPSRDNYVKEKY
ncbi:hypothetical protein C4D60_Mb04t26750 [Musa balbisiana]|uniref:Uncharacterized protein n=1 Tax=Musa balbisiana TaxID=52838 RepID=A0A4S8KFG0_MUSBA|nr:hypothetical protein C4D60_Mb04t26750 [Musa balbisiana]